MMTTIISVVAMMGCLVSLWRSIHLRSNRFDKVFFAVIAIVFIVIGIIFNNSN